MPVSCIDDNRIHSSIREGAGIAVYYEHPEWFTPLFAELERRGVPFTPVKPGDEVLAPDRPGWPYELVLNRMSPSAHLRGGAGALRYTSEYLRHLDSAGVRVTFIHPDGSRDQVVLSVR